MKIKLHKNRWPLYVIPLTLVALAIYIIIGVIFG